jgi:hypothetical protein
LPIIARTLATGPPEVSVREAAFAAMDGLGCFRYLG